MTHTAYIGIGSNLGDKQKNCEMAVEELRQRKDAKVVAISKWYETEAVTISNEKQPSYVNGAAKILTSLEPVALLQALKDIETKMGRPVDHVKWSPRIIDLDILFYDDLVFSSEGLTIPHPEAAKRIFVLKPMCDIKPRLVHPVIKRKLSAISRSAKQEA